MRKIILTVVLVLGLNACASADVATVRQNLDKYWLYRAIQRTDFVETGIGQGYSMPACWRNPDTHMIAWGDATIDLGWYIGALATEHYMLSHPETFSGYVSGGGDLNTVRNELYWALSAMDRLDATAEICWDPLAPDTPGFFIRDDVPAGFYSNFPGMTVLGSDYTNPDVWAKEMSQDQVVHVLLGLCLAKKLIPSDLVVNGMNLRAAAIDRGADIVDWVHQAGWIIKNPVLGTDVVRGEDARAFSTGFNRSCVYLTDGAIDFGGTISGFYAWVWSTLSSPSNPAYDNENNLHMAMSLAATANGWGDSSTLDDLMSLANLQDWYAYVLLYAALYNPIPQTRPTWPGHQATVNGLVQSMLNLAPATATPHEPSDPSEYNTGWCACRRFLGSRSAQNNGQGDPGRQNTGLDYLVLHNLFYIVTPSLWEDPSPVGDVTGFTAMPSDNQVSLSWTNPSDAEFTGTMIRYKTTGYPTGPTDGTLVVDKSNSPGSADSHVHTGLTNGILHYYKAFAHDVVPVYASGASASATPADATAPAPLATFTVTSFSQQNSLAWTNPGTSDFAGTMVRYKTTGYPTSASDGALVCNKTNAPGSSDSYTHTSLTNGVTYYYSAYAYDEVPNYASARTASGTPSSTSGCFSDAFAYANGNLNGNGGWSGTATSQIAVDGQAVKITGGAVSYDAGHTISCTGGIAGVIEVRLQVQGGAGGATMWGLWIDDSSGANMARWYGTAQTAIGRIGGTASITPTATLTGGWDNLVVRINTINNQSHFLFNGTLLGTLDHTGAGDTAGQVRFDRVDNGGADGDSLYLDNLWVGEGDATAPASVTSFLATRGDMQVTLTWHNPSDADFTATMIRYKTTGFPTGPTDGTLLIDKPNSPNSDDSYVHAPLINGRLYYYSAFAHDGVLNYAVKKNASATPADTTAPGPVSGFQAIAGNQLNNLMWTNPGDADFAGVKILTKTTGYPSSPTDGTVVYTGTGTSCAHTSLSNGTTCYYAAYAYDEVPNHSTAVQASIAPLYFGPVQAKLCANGAPLTLTVGEVSAIGTDWFYARCPHPEPVEGAGCGPIGIKIVKSAHGVLVGQSVGAKGTAQTDPTTGEKYVSATWASGSGSGSVAALGMANRALGGAGWNYNPSTGAGQQGIEGASGANNIGVLVRVWGKVTQRDTSGLQYFYVDDGSGLLDGTQTLGVGNVGIRIKADPTSYPPDTYVVVTGVSSCFKDGSLKVRPQVIPLPGGIEIL